MPWLQSLHVLLFQWVTKGTKGVLACSALKRSYRDILTGRDMDRDITQHCMFVLLNGSFEVLNSRMRTRSGHFMPQSMLQSQIETLELPSSDEISIECDISKSIEDIVHDVLSKIVDTVSEQQY